MAHLQELPAPASPFDALPHAVLRVIMLALPADARGRCACVCRGWRHLLADPALWQVLDLTRAGGVAYHLITPALVEAVAARAAGQLRVLNRETSVEQCVNVEEYIYADTAALRALDAGDRYRDVRSVRILLALAPQLEVLEVSLRDKAEGLVTPALLNQPPFEKLRVNLVNIDFEDVSRDDALEAAAAVAAHPWLAMLSMCYLKPDDPGLLDALLDAAVARRIELFQLKFCTIHADNVPALTRLLACGSLITLSVVDCGSFPRLHEHEHDPTLLAAALRTCESLESLQLRINWLPADHAAVVAMLEEAAELPELSCFSVSTTRDLEPALKHAAGLALGALLAADSVTLHSLDVAQCGLGDSGLAPLLEGLAANTHLRELHCHRNGVSEEFERNVLAPALAALAARDAAN